MDIGALFLTLAVATLVALYLFQPYMERRTKMVSAEEHEHSHLLAERDRYINALKELDFDYELGKVPEDEYPVQRANLLKKGADALRQLDEYEGAKSTSAEDRLEAVIAARRADATGTPDTAPKADVASATLDADDELESLIAARRSKRKAKSGGFCPNCGHAVLATDKFCTNCGKKTN